MPTRRNKKPRKHTLKHKNCSPVIEGKTPKGADTCFPEYILLKIRDAYNADTRHTPIQETDPTKIWHTLRERLKPQCQTEDCWLGQLKNTTLRKQINDLVFAPKQPPEWKKNPTEWLSNFDIFAVLKQYEAAHPQFKVIGPTPIDYATRLPEQNGKCVWEDLCHLDLARLIKAEGKRKIGVVFNLDRYDEPGSHWTSMFIDVDHRLVFYFDSAANPTPGEVNTLVQEIKKQGNAMGIDFQYMENWPKSHQLSDTECGMYSLFFIITMLTGEIEGRSVSYEDRLALFLGKTKAKTKAKTNRGGISTHYETFKRRIPDKYVEGYRSKYFNK